MAQFHVHLVSNKASELLKTFYFIFYKYYYAIHCFLPMEIACNGAQIIIDHCNGKMSDVRLALLVNTEGDALYEWG